MRPILLVTLPLALLACGGKRTATTAASPASEPALAQAQPGALQRFAAGKLLVLPVQGLRATGAEGWRGAAAADTAITRAVDRAIEQLLVDRGLGSQWALASSAVRAARRNPTYITDPYLLRGGDAVRYALRRPDVPFGEPFSSQIRAHAGVGDSRYVLVPAELRIEPILPGTDRRVVLRLAIVDARGASLVWAGEVGGAAAPAWGDAVARELAQRVADLVVPR